MPEQSQNRSSAITVGAAVAVLVAFGVFVGLMMARADSGEQTWTRLAWLFSSVEAVAFGAAGLLFGSGIQRARAERAEGEADMARQDAHQHLSDAANGRALAAAIEAAAPPDDAADNGFERLGLLARRATRRR